MVNKILGAALFVTLCAAAPRLWANEPAAQQTPPRLAEAADMAAAPTAAEPAADAGAVDNGAAVAGADEQRPPSVLIVSEDNLDALKTLTQNRVRAVSVGVTRATLDDNADDRDALLNWVRFGGTVFVHTDAAQLFGYQTVAPRATTNGVAGQFWGRARAALRLGSNPLLAGGTADDMAAGDANGAGAANLDRSLLPAVRTVYYELEDDDVLVSAHSAAVPILEVVDVAARLQRPLYAAAVAPYGHGWALFTPGVVVPDRADGARFLTNIMKWAGALVPDDEAAAADEGEAPVMPNGDANRDAETSPINVTRTVLETAAVAAQGQGFDAQQIAEGFIKAAAQPIDAVIAAVPIQATGAADAGDATGAAGAPVLAATADEGGLALSRGELAAAIRLLETTKQADPDAVNLARATVFMLRARLAWQDGDSGLTAQWLSRANDAVGDTAETLLLSGLQNADAAADLSLASPMRSRLMANAADQLQRSMTAPRLLVPAVLPVARGAAAGANRPDDSVAGFSRELVTSWIAAANFATRLYALEPPLVTVVGDDDNKIAVRYFANDPTLRLAIPTARGLASVAGDLGMSAENEEFLFFPSAEYYSAYRNAAGLGAQTAAAPAGYYGDAIGGRVLLLSQLSLIAVLPGVPVGGKPAVPRIVPLGNAVPKIMGRLHAQVLLNQIAGDGDNGNALRSWLRFGLAGYSSKATSAALGDKLIVNNDVERQATIGAVYSPQDYDAAGNGQGLDPVMDAQATRIVAYMYGHYGAGRVVELLEQMGTGVEFDDALDNALGANEAQIFRARYAADSGR